MRYCRSSRPRASTQPHSNGTITVDPAFSVPVLGLVFGQVATGEIRGGGTSTITLRSTNGDIKVGVA